MKSKSLILLILVLAVIGGLAYLQRKPDQRETASGPDERGKLLDFDMNDVNTIIIDTPSSTQNVTLARVAKKWVVANRSNYPANYDDVSASLRKLALLKQGEEIRGGTDYLEEFGLAPTTNSAAGDSLLVLSFFGKAGHVFGDLALGAPRLAGGTATSPGFPQGQYVRFKDGPVYVIDELITEIQRTPADWLDKALLDIPKTDIAHVVRTLPDGSSYEVLQSTNGTYTVPGLGAEEEVKTDGAALVFTCLSGLRIADVASLTNTVEGMGFDKAEQYQALLTNGILYSVAIGQSNPALGGRYAKITVFYDAPETEGLGTEQVEALLKVAKHAEAEDQRLSKWVFILPESTCMNLALPREQVAGPKSPVTAPGTTPSSG